MTTPNLTLFANQPSTTVATGGTAAPASGTSEQWTVGSSTPFPVATLSSTPPTTFNVADTASTSEIIAVTAITSNVWGVTRGAESTIPVTHSPGFTIMQVVSAGDLNSFQQTWQGGATAFTGVTSNAATTVASYHPPANDIPEAGIVYDVCVFGFLTTAATSRTFTVTLEWGGTTIVSAATGTNGTAFPAAALTRVGAWIEGRIICTSSSAMVGSLNMQTYGGTTAVSIANASTVATTGLSSSGPLAVVVQWGTASTSYAFTAASSLIHRIS